MLYPIAYIKKMLYLCTVKRFYYMIHHFKGGEKYEVLTPLFDITPHTNFLEFLINGMFYYYEFNNDHTIREKSIFNLQKL